MLHARGQSTAVLQQQHVDRLHRRTIYTTSADMAHANGPTARCNFSTCPLFFCSYNEVFVQTAFSPYYLSTDIDFVCVLCTSSSTAAVASLSVEKLRGNFVEAHTLPIRAECSVKEQSWNILHDSPASVV